MSSDNSSPGGARPSLALFALSMGTFGVGTTEFAPMGLLPTIAEGVGVSIPTAGLLVSAYAMGVLVSAPFITVGMARWSQKTSLMLLMLLFTVGNVLAALAPNYEFLLVARVITSLCHGAFMGIGSVVAVSLVPRDKQGFAISMLLMGLTLANVAGVPAATWLGQVAGWRQAFLVTALIGLVTIAFLYACLPNVKARAAYTFRDELRVLRRGDVLLSMLMTVIAASAMFTVYTYVSPILMEFAEISPRALTLILALIGCGFLVGNLVSGRLADISLNGTLIGALVLFAVLTGALPFLATGHVSSALCMFVWGAVSFAVVPPLQTRVMNSAAAAPNLASSMNIGAFNLGNAIGAAAGGAVVAAAFNYATVTLVSAVIAGLGAVLVSIRALSQGKKTRFDQADVYSE